MVGGSRGWRYRSTSWAGPAPGTGATNGPAEAENEQSRRANPLTHASSATDLCYLPATEAQRLFRAQKLSPVELTKAIIARAENVEPGINAFAETFYDQALDKAEQAEARYAGRGEPPRPLEGLLVAVKEEAPISGQRNTLGSLPLRDVVADQTATFVQRILDAGGIVHARTTTPEFSCAPVTWSRLWGVTRNPWHRDYSPGGSSGGSAASLAAGTTTLATGSDIGGSIRIPAAFCGVVGFKPPYGRVPEVKIFNLDHYCSEGPLARTVADCALLENVIAGPHPSDVASLRPKLDIPAELAPAHGLRIAYSPDLGCYNVDADVVANAYAAADRLREAGAVVEEVTLPWRLQDINRAANIHFGMIFGPSVRELYEQHADELTSYARRFVTDSDKISKNDLVAGLELEGRIYAPLGALLADYDALICPTFAVPALPAEHDVADPLAVNGQPCSDWLDVLMTLPFNIANRCPVLSVPSGLSRDGVPTGLSVVGRTYDDVTAFRVAAAHEARFRWLDVASRRPPL
jgi:Asp-tRNA(Asn)/Glu-tRNA(Gln) amidotransferase A subunit family amidase